MAYTITSDISRMLVEGQRDIFMENFNPFPIEYPQFSTKKSSTKETETYDSLGNLQGAYVKVEGDAISYGKVGQAYQTSIKNQTHVNGYAHSFEAIKYDLYGCINSIKAKELSRTMREEEEETVITQWNNAFTTNLADGQPLCANAKPLVNSGSTNDTLATASSLTVPENHKTMIKMFSAFLNHAGGRFKSFPTNGMTHIQNMMDIEEIYGSTLKANEISNTKNSLPKIKWVYATYLASLTAWFMWDSKFEHVLFQEHTGTAFDQDEDKISTKNMYYNAIGLYAAGTLPNIGIVGNAGA
jgi:hypothetical protein